MKKVLSLSLIGFSFFANAMDHDEAIQSVSTGIGDHFTLSQEDIDDLAFGLRRYVLFNIACAVTGNSGVGTRAESWVRLQLDRWTNKSFCPGHEGLEQVSEPFNVWAAGVVARIENFMRLKEKSKIEIPAFSVNGIEILAAYEEPVISVALAAQMLYPI